MKPISVNTVKTARETFPVKELRYLLIYAWVKGDIDKNDYSIKKCFMRILLRKLQAKERTKLFVKTADPNQLGQALYRFGILEPVTKEKGIYKFNRSMFDLFLKNLDKDELAFKRTFFQAKEYLNPTIKHVKSLKTIYVHRDSPFVIHLCEVCQLSFDDNPSYVSHVVQYHHCENEQIGCWKSCQQSQICVSVEFDEENLQMNLVISSRTKVLNVNCVAILVRSLDVFATVLNFDTCLTPMKKIWIPFNRMILDDPDDVFTVAFQLIDDLESTVQIEVYKLEVEGSMIAVLNRSRIYLRDILQEKMTPLPSHASDKSILNFLDDDFKVKEVAFKKHGAKYKNLSQYLKNGCELTPENYTETLKTLNEIEDLYVTKQLERFLLEERAVIKCSNGYFVLDIEDDELPNSINERDVIHLSIVALKMEVSGEIIDINDERIIFQSDDLLTLSRVEENFNELSYDVRFRKEKSTFAMEQEALSRLEQKIVRKVLFVDQQNTLPEDSVNFKYQKSLQVFDYENFDWVSSTIPRNQEQMKAVKDILQNTSYPAPYILFGPPGTGKTTTLVEAIVQIWKQKPHDRILVCAYSNYAVDEIGQRVLQFIPGDDCYRLYAQTMVCKRSFLKEKLLEISNFKGRTSSTPSIEELLSYRIVFITLTSSGWLGLKNFPKNKFNYIFIDECGSATEAATIIPIANLVSMKEPGQVQIVLAGDPKQLGPVITCKSVAEMGLNRSLMARLMQEKHYTPGARGFNSSAFTKLIQNFRSHQAILQVPNQLFYDNELIAMSYINKHPLKVSFLPNQSFPIVFHATQGHCQSDGHSKSLYNLHEIVEVMTYVYLLINSDIVKCSDIGIVTPYKRQVKEIRKCLTRLNITGVEVGSTEQFQGREKMVVIISTVRSNVKSVGFLSNPQRLNVAITRAQALLIIVGDPTTLCLDDNWRYLISYCFDSGSFVVGNF